MYFAEFVRLRAAQEALAVHAQAPRQGRCACVPIDIDEVAARAGRSVDELSDALAEFQLDRILPA